MSKKNIPVHKVLDFLQPGQSNQNYDFEDFDDPEMKNVKSQRPKIGKNNTNNDKNNNSPGVYEIKIDEKKAKKQKKIEISGIDVYFPYDPYDVQVSYMESVIKSLQGKQHALLQSPTGTGKTLCLLCASLAWLHYKRKEQIKNKEKDPVRIIYSSRTHSQIKQVISELKKTVYKPASSILGSRDQYCIKRDFAKIKGAALLSSCLKACKGTESRQEETKCSYFQPLQAQDYKGQYNGDILDIEELKHLGREQGFCPYFHSRRIKDVCDILLLPYNYLLDLSAFPVFKLDLQDSVVIFDEAHNVQSVSEDGASYELSINVLNEVEKEAKLLEENILKDFKDPNRTTQAFKNKMKDVSEIETQGLKSTTDRVRSFMSPVVSFRKNMMLLMGDQSRVKLQGQNEKGFLAEGKEIFEFLENYTRYEKESGQQQKKQAQLFGYGNKRVASGLTGGMVDYSKTKFANGLSVDNMSEYLEIGTGMISDLATTKNWGLDSWTQFLKGVSDLYSCDLLSNKKGNAWNANKINHYKLYFKVDVESNICSFHLWCMDPSISFQRLLEKQPQNIILTSGTIAPFDPWQAELKMDFKVQLSNGHVIDNKQNLMSGVLRKGPAGKDLIFDFKNRDNEDMINDLGMSIINLCRNIPNGVLIIFSSYQVLTKCRTVWFNHSFEVMKRLNEVKEVIIEPKQSADMQETMDDYCKKAKTKKGAILFAVCRGKISEGIDFTDELARAVFIVGVPYPPFKEKKVEVKQEYLDKVCTRPDIEATYKLTGRNWYDLQAVRAMNQAIGRVIRHRNDWGGVFFCDQRYDGKTLNSQISNWMQEEMTSWANFGMAYKSANTFYNDWQQRVKDNKPLQLSEYNEIEKKENSKKGINGWCASNLQQKNKSKRFGQPSLLNENSNSQTSILDSQLQTKPQQKKLLFKNFQEVSGSNHNSQSNSFRNNNDSQAPADNKECRNSMSFDECSQNFQNNNCSNTNNNINNYNNSNSNQTVGFTQNNINGYKNFQLQTKPKVNITNNLQNLFKNNSSKIGNLCNRNPLNTSQNIISQVKQMETPQKPQQQQEQQIQTPNQGGGILGKLKSLQKFKQQQQQNQQDSFQFEDNSISNNNNQLNNNFDNINNQMQNVQVSNNINNINATSNQNGNISNRFQNPLKKAQNNARDSNLDFDKQLKQFEYSKSHKKPEKQEQIQQEEKQQQEEDVEIDDSRCVICKRQKMRNPMFNKMCGHVACQRCWAQQMEMSLTCVCKKKLNQKYLQDY